MVPRSATRLQAPSAVDEPPSRQDRSTSHLAPTDIFQSDFDRQLYRITLVGQPLVGVDGRPSTAIEGLPILSAAEELRIMAAE